MTHVGMRFEGNTQMPDAALVLWYQLTTRSQISLQMT